MANKSAVGVVNFFVFNAAYGSTEGEEHKKIFYYHPSETPLDTQIRNVGLCEAVIKFADSFHPNGPCEAVHTQKTRQLFLEAEPGFWMVLTVSIPYVQKVKDNRAYAEYHGDDVQDNVYGAILEQAYQMFKLFMGPFHDGTRDSRGIVHLKQKLDHFYSRYLPTLKLDGADVTDAFRGIYFLPLDKHNFLKIQFFVNRLEAQFPHVAHVVFLYNDQLVWSGLEREDVQIVYKYLVTSLFPAYMETELQSESPLTGRHRQTPLGGSHYGRYVTGPPNLDEPSATGKVPRIYVDADDACEERHLVVYRALSATVCLIVDASQTLTMEHYKKMDRFLGPNLTSLASEIGEHYGKRTSGSFGEPAYKFVYFNRMNLAQKSTVHADVKRTGSSSVPADVVKLLADLSADLTRTDGSGEIVVKTASDCWVVGKYSDRREFYVIVNQKNANLIEVNEEVKKLCATHFNNIFLSD